MCRGHTACWLPTSALRALGLGPRWKKLPAIGSDFPGIPSGALPQKPVIANGLSFGVGKEFPL